mmetsp:Transcript_102327/g.329960  ORF Transcript_102327/g.329960 Transcript_102327/m.329960 type:complete len:250 (-) Transcript_102327:229-978(-)
MALALMRRWDELQQALPRLQRFAQAVRDSAGKFQSSEVVQLRSVEESLSDWAGLVARLSSLQGELRGCSRTSLVLVALVALKAVRVLNHLVDTLLAEILSRQSLPARVLLFQSCMSGWVALYTFWDNIVQHLDASVPTLQPSAVNGGLEEGAEWYVQLIRNLKRLPAIFWYSTSASCLVALQASQALGAHSIRFAARSLLGALLLQFVGVGIGFLAHRVVHLTEDETLALRRRTATGLGRAFSHPRFSS